MPLPSNTPSLVFGASLIGRSCLVLKVMLGWWGDTQDFGVELVQRDAVFVLLQLHTSVQGFPSLLSDIQVTSLKFTSSKQAVGGLQSHLPAFLCVLWASAGLLEMESLPL